MPVDLIPMAKDVGQRLVQSIKSFLGEKAETSFRVERDKDVTRLIVNVPAPSGEIPAGDFKERNISWKPQPKIVNSMEAMRQDILVQAIRFAAANFLARQVQTQLEQLK